MKIARLVCPMCPALKGCIVEVLHEVKDGLGEVKKYQTHNPLSNDPSSTVEHLPESLEIIER